MGLWELTVNRRRQDDNVPVSEDFLLNLENEEIIDKPEVKNELGINLELL